MKEHLENKPKTYSSSVNYSNAEQKALSIIKRYLQGLNLQSNTLVLLFYLTTLFLYYYFNIL